MKEYIHGIAEWLALAVEGGGIAVIILGFVYAFIHGLVGRKHQGSWEGIYEELRKDIGRTLLLGLEFLLAAEIVRSIMIGEELNSVLILGLVVVIRTFLSISLEMEINGRWPWQADRIRSTRE
jgi:uncharacterized membrane protein